MIDWKRKLTSRKFWAAVCGFVSMVVMAFGKDASTAQTVTGMVMAAGSLIAYMIGEGLADSGGGVLPEAVTIMTDDGELIADVCDGKAVCKKGYKCVQADADDYNPFSGYNCGDCKITFEEEDN